MGAEVGADAGDFTGGAALSPDPAVATAVATAAVATAAVTAAAGTPTAGLEAEVPEVPEVLEVPATDDAGIGIEAALEGSAGATLSVAAAF